MKPHLDPRQRCDCTRPLPSGRYYMRWQVCRLCGLYLVGERVKRALEAEEERRMRDAWARRGGIIEKMGDGA